jgi:GntR family transcriptional regulator
MLFRIDTANSIPVYAQIVEQVKRAIAIGTLRPGDGLPSLRETALKLRINPLTVSKAYKQLETEGLIETRHGLGSVVSLTVDGPAGDYRREVLERSVDGLLADAAQLGVTSDEVRVLLEERIRAMEGHDGSE